MKVKRSIYVLLAVIMLASLVVGGVLAEDGLIFRRNVSKTPEGETEKAAIYMMDFYVPAQASTGFVGPVDNYLLADGVTAGFEPRDYAKPLVSVYIDDIAHELAVPEGMSGIYGGITFGHFDAFVGVSLDDGTSWKTTNLSRSADLSSFTLGNGYVYPGDVHNVVHQVAGDQIFVAWASKYCDGGTPLYSLDPTADVAYFDDLELTYGKDAVFLYDLFGVAGNQGSVDYTEQGFPEIGEIPYSCIWTERGKLLAGDDPTTAELESTYVMWAKPERLTSGRRDANLPAVDCAVGAGCILTWQEDPEGLRPGQGLGPGEGWSGAIANQKTDIWYSYISYADFDLVFDDAGTVAAPLTMAEYALLTDATMPKPYVPMAIPTRLTDNNMCKATNSDPYCYIDFDNVAAIDPLALPTAPTGDSDFCATQVYWTNPGGTILNICVTEDGRPLNGQVASTRVRLNLKPYTPAGAVDTDLDGVVDRSAWLIMAYEETKALGDMVDEVTLDPIDIGKDVWYHSFDMFNHDYVNQGGMLNQPALCKDDEEDFCTGGVGEFYDIQTDEFLNEFYLTEIARRFALTTNSVQDAIDSESGLSAMLIYKQGIINQGGPADIFLRRLLIDDTAFDKAVDNPYAFENMECSEWAYTDDTNGGSNPNYLKGICLSPAINISGNTIVECEGTTGNDACADLFPVSDDGSISDDIADFPKVTEWRQCYDGTESFAGCEDDNDLDDQSWDNPFDVAKGHRGFLDKDFVMMMYAWAPNWKANTVGNDHYNLYVRRSFDGGLTWTTTPASLEGAGTTAIENYCVNTASADCVGTEFVYGAGDFEQGRNVSQLIGNKITILDPRYSPTGGLKLYPTIRTDWLEANVGAPTETLPYDDDLERDASKFFMIYETGDNTTVDVGEAIPLDLFYSRATVYGDFWEMMDYTTTTDDELLDRWPWLEKDAEDLSGEAGMVANPGGTFMYTVWNQWKEEILPDGHELVYDSDMIFRRLLYLPDDSTIELPPTAEILYVSSTALDISAGDTLTMIGTGRDLDRLNGDPADINPMWFDDKGAILCAITGYDDLGSPIYTCEKVMQVNAAEMVPGVHKIHFQVKDGEGRLSEDLTMDILVAQVLYKVRLPSVLMNK